MRSVEFTSASIWHGPEGHMLALNIPFQTQARDLLTKLKPEKTYVAEIKEKKGKRSLNSNNYSWLLTDKLSDVMVIRGVKLSKDEMHAEMIFRYGQVALDENGQQLTYSTAQKANLSEFYPYAKEYAESELNGKLFKHYRIYRGSHTYDSKEMAVFIAGIVEECKEQGIQTLTPSEIALMNDDWRAQR
ncbi:MAG: hypothetical protein IJZ15_04235 [Oscillospiraceae bacterium]|nr:hypothetical protein [Oscillospiraceae bacterium]